MGASAGSGANGIAEPGLALAARAVSIRRPVPPIDLVAMPLQDAQSLSGTPSPGTGPRLDLPAAACAQGATQSAEVSEGRRR